MKCGTIKPRTAKHTGTKHQNNRMGSLSSELVVDQEEELLRRRVYGTSRKKSKSSTIHGHDWTLRQMGAGRKGANDEHGWRNGRRHGVRE
jgi:hypothetical protein